MSIWNDHSVADKIEEILGDVRTGPAAHHFGRPYITAYQLAIGLDRRYPEVAQALGVTVGGNGNGQQTSLAQYLAKQLSDRIRDDALYPVEGAFISNQDVHSLEFEGADSHVRASFTENGYDLSLFRTRA